ncbi:hypothetical protein HC928_05180 [bacterium]|nr:hypothetical protein [bacterium]
MGTGFWACDEVEKKIAEKFGIVENLPTFALPKRWERQRKESVFIFKIKRFESLEMWGACTTFVLQTLFAKLGFWGFGLQIFFLFPLVF